MALRAIQPPIGDLLIKDQAILRAGAFFMEPGYVAHAPSLSHRPASTDRFSDFAQV